MTTILDRCRYGTKLVRAVQLSNPIASIEMIRTFRRVAPYTGVDVPRLRDLWILGRKINALGIEGSVVQCGAQNGGSAAVLGRAAVGRDIWLFDSFEGFPAPSENDPVPSTIAINKGDRVGEIAKVNQVMRLAAGVNVNRLHIVPGWFDATLAETAPTIGPIALLSLDADLYESTKLSLDVLYDQVSPGGFITIDDYGFWPGCRKAVDGFLLERRLSVNLVVSDAFGRWFQKPTSAP